MAFSGYTEVEDISDLNETAEEMQQGRGEEAGSLQQTDEEKIDQGNLLNDAINQNLSAFNPEVMMDQLVKNFSLAKSLFGDSMLRRVSGYDPGYIQRNIKIPEFRDELKKRIKEKVEKLKESTMLDEEGQITDDAYGLAGNALFLEELKDARPKGILGEKIHKKNSAYGDRHEERNYKHGDKWKDVSLKKTVKNAIRQRKNEIDETSLVVTERKSRGKISVVYALDASGSMKGRKIDLCKKAGAALAYTAINEKDSVGLIAFSTEVKQKVMPTQDFKLILSSIARIRPSMQTNIAETIRQSIGMFGKDTMTKHLILITDALPTYGKTPEEETLSAVALAYNSGITFSLIGINLDKEGEKFAKKIVEACNGRSYIVRDVKEIDKIVLEDYYSVV